MRNLKKFLALVLAMMMTFSLMVTVNASSKFTDSNEINPKFSEAVQVLEGLKVFKGYANGDKFDFRPGDPITRAEVATIVYRLATGDAAGDKEYLYEGGAKKFKDVPDDHWASGAIGYCANNLLVRGYDDVRFGPSDYVTGVQAITMILRAVGYGQGGEFEGWGWETRAYGRARAEGLLVNVDNSNYTGKLTEVATRELVAELLFQAALIPQVTWTEALGYNKTDNAFGWGSQNPSLATENFGLKVNGYTTDDWGRPSYSWVYKGGTAATIKVAFKKDYNTTVRECDVAHDLGIESATTYTLYVNSGTPTTSSYTIEPTDTVTKVGGQGRITEFYSALSHPYSDKDYFGTGSKTLPASVVMIDTYLAKVVGVSAPILDKNQHVIVQAKLDLEVYDATMSSTAYPNGVGTNNPLDSTLKDADGKFPSKHTLSQDKAYDYTVGQMLLVRGYTDYSQYNDNQGPDTNGDGTVDASDTAAGTNTTGLNHTINAADIEKTAFETNVLKASDTAAKISIVGEPTMKIARQTKTYWNTDKHNVDGQDYNDHMTLFLDRAKTDTNVSWAWYFDEAGNLMGIDEAPTNTQYGVITSLYSAFNQGDSYTDGTTKAIATVLMADGSTQTITIDRFLMGSDTAVTDGRYVSTDDAAGGKKLTDADNNLASDDVAIANNNVELIPQYDYNGGASLMISSAGFTTGTAHNAQLKANLYVAPITSLNDQAENDGATAWAPDSANGHFGIIRGNMFKFVNTQYGMTAVEVAGVRNANHNNENTGIYEWHYHALTDATAKLTKNLGILTVNDEPNTITVSNSTKIMIKSSDNDKVITVYDGLSKLPGDVTIADDSEVDWVDFNGDGRVDYVYLTGRVTGTITYGLFYYNGGEAIWNGTEGTGILTGWLNGEAATVSFDDQTEFDLIKNHTSNVAAQDYKAHLFALQMINGVVSNVMNSQDATAGIYLLATSPDAQTTGNIKVHNSGSLFALTNTDETATIKTSNGAAENFRLGGIASKWGNPYNQYTGLAYHKDVHGNAAATDTNVVYNPGTSTVTYNTPTAGTTYHITEATKIIGMGRGVSYGENVLYYLNECDNDVTVVYDKSDGTNMVALEIYVATDPDWTPGTAGTGAPKTISGTNAKVVTSADAAALTKNLKIAAATGNQVLFDNGTAVFAGGAGDSVAGKTLFFPFIAVNSTTGAVLRVWDKSTGEVKWAENMAAATVDTVGGVYTFYFDFTQYKSGVTAIVNNLPLSVGATYEFSIIQGTTTVSSGEFTVG